MPYYPPNNGGGGGAQIYTWNGATYVLNSTVKVLLGPTDPTTVGLAADKYDFWAMTQD